MKLYIHTLFIIFFSLTVTAQVGIGTTTPAGALDVTSTSDGLLIPRVALTIGANLPFPLSSPAVSELIYNTASVGSSPNIVTPGFYYWAGSRWERFVTGTVATTGWQTTGNSGLSGATNFLGTTDAVDVAFRRNNTTAGKISATSTAFGVGALSSGATTNSTAIGNNALSVSTGDNNVAIGQNALQNCNTTAQWNTAVGVNALKSINSNASQYNVALGFNALGNGTGNFSNCVAIGSNALLSNTGIKNTAIGDDAGRFITSGYNNIAIGYNSQVPIAGGNNQLQIGDGAISYAGIQVAWTITSDKKWKNTIKDSDLGLDFIKTIRPVSYIRNNDKAQKTEYGFIAQELEIALINAGDANNAIISKNDQGMYGVRYNDFISITIKAVQEQQEQIEKLKKANSELIKVNASILKRLETLEHN